MLAAAIVAEVGPPLAADEAGLSSEELAIDVAADGDDLTLPLPQWPVPSAIGEHHVTTVLVDHILGGEAVDAAVE